MKSILASTALVLFFLFQMTFAILKVVNVLVGLRVGGDEERHGLDVSLHNESGYNL